MFDELKTDLSTDRLKDDFFISLIEKTSTLNIYYHNSALELYSRFTDLRVIYNRGTISQGYFDQSLKIIRQELLSLFHQIDISGGEKKYMTSFISKTKRLYPSGGKVIGRTKELREFAEILKRKEVKQVVLSGIGGIGKSTFCSLYLNNYNFRYQHVAWLEFTGNIKNDLVEAIESNKELKIKNPKSSEAKVEKRYEKLLRQLHKLEGPNLIVIDNVNSSKEEVDVKNFIKRFPPNWTFIITSRIIFSDFLNFEVPKMNESELVEFFLNHSNIKKVDNYILKILEEVEFHTLTSELIAKTIAKSKSLSPKKFLTEIKKQGLLNSTNNHKIKTPHDKKDSDIKLKQYLMLIFDLSQLSRFEKSILSCLSILPSILYTEKNFKELSKFLNHDFIKFLNTVNKLVTKGWLQSQSVGNYKLHGVISEVVSNKTKIPKGFESGLIRFIIERTNVDFSNESISSKVSWLPTIESEIKKIEKSKNKVERFLLVKLKINAARIYRHTGKNEKAKVTLEKLLIFLNKENRKPKQVAEFKNTIKGNLAIVYKNLGLHKEGLKVSFEALEYYKKKKNIEQIGLMLTKIGNIYNGNNEFKKAEKYNRKAIKTLDKLENKYLKAVALNDLASVFGNRIRTISSISLEIDKETQSEINQIALKANALLNEAIKIYLYTYKDEDHIWILYSKINQGANLVYANRNKEGKTILEFAAKKHFEIFKNKKHIDLLTIESHLSKAYFGLGQYQEAKSLLNDIVKRGKYILKNRIMLAHQYKLLGHTYQSLNKKEKAKNAYNKALKIAILKHPQSHPFVLYLKNSIISL